MVDGMGVNEKVIKDNFERSLMTVTVLNPIIGYDNSIRLANYAHEHGLSLFEANEILKIVDQDKIRQYLDPRKMV